MTQTPTIGRQVHYVLGNGQHRAATVVNAFGGSRANLTVHLDQANDFENDFDPATGQLKRQIVKNNLQPTGAADFGNGTLGVASAQQDEDTKAPGTWHWPERE
jgi:hypothetical protein